MLFKIFTISVADDGSAIEEMNRFLRSHKVLEKVKGIGDKKFERFGKSLLKKT